MVGAYDRGLRELPASTPRRRVIQRKVYVGLSGRATTPAEVACCASSAATWSASAVLGAIARGVSELFHLSWSHLAANKGGTHEEVLEMGRLAAARVGRLFAALLADPRLY
jgi:purine nucleoside phosphorylase